MNQETKAALERILRATEDGIAFSKFMPPSDPKMKQALLESAEKMEKDVFVVRQFMRNI